MTFITDKKESIKLGVFRRNSRKAPNLGKNYVFFKEIGKPIGPIIDGSIEM